MRISDWSSDVCSSDLDKDIYTPKLVIHFFDQCFGIDLLSDIRPTEDNGYSEILLYLGACDGAGLFVNFRDRDGCALARKPSSRDRKSVVKGKSVSVRVDLGGRSILKKQHK